MTHYLHELADGRKLGITGLGDPDATRLILFCHPSPGVGGFDPDPPVTSTAAVRIIAHDRPGYGGSDPITDDRTPMESWLKDLDAYLTTVESSARSDSDTDFGRLGVIGWGAGAMFASAFTARYPNIVERLALVEPTAPSTERAESTGDLDARLEDRHALQRRVDFPGLADRLGFMLDEVAEGDGSGAAFDRRVMNDETWQQSLHDIRAETLIVSTGVTPDARWYQKRIPGVLMSSGWPSPATSIVDAWPELLRFMRPRESPGGVRSSNLQGGLPFPQAPHLPR